MRKLLSLFLLAAACVSACGQAFVINTLKLTGPFTNTALASSGAYIVYAGTDGVLYLSPWTTNQWLWLTNSSGAGLGYSNAYSPLRIFGTLTVANLNGTVGSLTNGGWLSPTTTNLINYGLAASSRGSASTSEQFGIAASATGVGATAVGPATIASGQFGSSFGYSASAAGTSSTAIGAGASATGTNSVAIGVGSVATATNSSALGVYSNAGQSNSTAIGFNAQTTAALQIMLGSPGVSTVVNNWLSVLGGLTVGSPATNMTFSGTNVFVQGADISFARYPVTSLANGNNAAVPIGTNVFVDLSGPSGAFTICGINGSPNRDGKEVELHNNTGFTMTIANQSGTDPTAGNRILTGFSADHNYTNNPGVVGLRYNGNLSRWVVIYQNGNQ